ALTGSTAYAYDGDTTTVTDQGGKITTRRIDALGRIVAATAGSSSSATYGYDVLDNLTSVTQSDPGYTAFTAAQTRTFGYDSLSRVVSSTNPESGSMTYGYDDYGNLISRVDSRGVATAYTYDGLNRVTSKVYTIPAVTPPVAPTPSIY